MDVYEETNRSTGRIAYPGKSGNLQILYAEQDFYRYLELFFGEPSAIYAVWAEGGMYKAALRLETYRDGKLITGLETHPAARRHGYATKLVRAVVERENNNAPIYSHVEKKNPTSRAVHEKCGFAVTANDAVFLDGSYHTDYDTLMYSHEK